MSVIGDRLHIFGLFCIAVSFLNKTISQGSIAACLRYEGNILEVW